MPTRPRHFLVWGVAWAALAFAVDQATKAVALAAAPALARGVERLPFFDLVLVHNRGMSFGLLANDHPAGRWLLILLAGAISAVLVVWLMRAQSRTQAAALGLTIGGALGNLVDRLRHGAVTDFLDFTPRATTGRRSTWRIAASFWGALLLIVELRAPAGRELSGRQA